MSEDKTEAKSIPLDRFNAVVTERNELRSTVENLKSAVSSTADTVATVEALQKELTELKSAYDQSKQDWNTDRELLTAGIRDEEGRDIARFLFSKLPEENKPELSEWLKTATSDPSSAPRALVPYLETKSATPEKTETADQVSPAGVPSSNQGAKSTNQPATAQTVSDERIKELRMDAVRTGDWTSYREHRDGILKSLRSS